MNANKGWNWITRRLTSPEFQQGQDLADGTSVDHGQNHGVISGDTVLGRILTSIACACQNARDVSRDCRLMVQHVVQERMHWPVFGRASHWPDGGRRIPVQNARYPGARRQLASVPQVHDIRPAVPGAPVDTLQDELWSQPIYWLVQLVGGDVGAGADRAGRRGMPSRTTDVEDKRRRPTV